MDAFNGSPYNVGGRECPVNTITLGIQLALDYESTQVVVRGGTYYEDVRLEQGIHLKGEPQIHEGSEWVPLIAPSNVSYAVIAHAADGAMIEGFSIVGGVQIEDTDALTLSHNIISGSTISLDLDNCQNGKFRNNTITQLGKGYCVVLLEGGSSDNTFVNNTIHRTRDGNIVVLNANTDNNTFRNNILHAATLSGTTIPTFRPDSCGSIRY